MDRDLVTRAMAGDREAFSELVRRSIDRLYAVARLILRDPDLAEDATQDALVAAWRDLSAIRDPAAFDGWLYRVLVRTCHRLARRDRVARAALVRELELRHPSGAIEADTSVGLADRDVLEQAFRRLHTDERAILVLHFHLGLGPSEIAETLAIPTGTAKSRLHRATQALRSALDAESRTPVLGGGLVR